MKTVYVGLSGGVDSAVSAALLQEAGYRVVGAFIKIWRPEFTECTWRDDRLEAMRVASYLGIPFEELDLSDEYKKQVIDETASGYARGITPNPDVLCNKAIKFGSFFTWAKKQGADFIATGHYAQIKKGTLMRGADTSKDQSYFLWQLPQEILPYVLFPVGGMQKSEVRAHAHARALPNAHRPDSQGVCFIGSISMDEFLRRVIPVRPGAVLNREGHAIGRHGGAALYTIGQRHGFLLDTADRPHYVVSRNVKLNTITVSPHREDAATNYLEGEMQLWRKEITLPARVQIQARYRQTAVPGEISKKAGGVSILTADPVVASPGQSLVFYDKDIVVGGAICTATTHAKK